MLARCYSGKYPTYEGCTVADEWYNFQNFAEWFTNQENWNCCGYELDKDLLAGGRGKLYSSETCIVINRAANMSVVKLQSTNTNGVTGVSIHYTKSGPRYRAFISIDGVNTYIGSYLTMEEAERQYSNAKDNYIKSKLQSR